MFWLQVYASQVPFSTALPRGTGHLISLAIVAAAAASLIWGWQDPSEEARRRVRLLIAGVALLNEISWHY